MQVPLRITATPFIQLIRSRCGNPMCRKQLQCRGLFGDTTAQPQAFSIWAFTIRVGHKTLSYILIYAMVCGLHSIRFMTLFLYPVHGGSFRLFHAFQDMSISPACRGILTALFALLSYL
ncbi:hypothetical protein GGR53DRAFT_134714 [Hypoxylon sp. FL1150]|nr:hypothetical protein GGR53DRAFT_134714 [Hypoxylon sp. FL1150]